MFFRAWQGYAACAEHSFDQLSVLEIYAQMALFDPMEKQRLPGVCAQIDSLVSDKGLFPNAVAAVNRQQPKVNA